VTADDATEQAVARRLLGASSVAVCAHVNPDGDAVGSTLGIVLALRSAGVAAVPTLADEDPPPATYAFLPGYELFVPASEVSVPDVFLALDTPDPARLGVARAVAEGASDLIVVDHHASDDAFGSMNLVDTDAPAVSEMLWRMLPALGVTATREISTCLYTGLLTDTGRFQYSNTDADALRTAADMVEAGAEPAEIGRRLYQSRSAGTLALVGRTLSRLATANGGVVAHSWITSDDLAETDAGFTDTENLVDEVRSLAGASIAFLVKEADGECRVSLRAKSDFDVAAVARVFGGGGHAAAAGLTFQGTREDLLARLLPMLPGSRG
jgi:phosphoesterase RecJ-like protein